MKIFVFAIVLFSSLNSFALSQSGYCSNDAKKVAFLTIDIDATQPQRMSANTISLGVLVAELNDGTSVIVPCDSYNMNRALTHAVIVDQTKVFTMVKSKSIKEGSYDIQTIGSNYKTSMALVRETAFKLIKMYRIEKR